MSSAVTSSGRLSLMYARVALYACLALAFHSLSSFSSRPIRPASLRSCSFFWVNAIVSLPEDHAGCPPRGQKDRDELNHEESDRPSVERRRATQRQPGQACRDGDKAVAERSKQPPAGHAIRPDHRRRHVAAKRLEGGDHHAEEHEDEAGEGTGNAKDGKHDIFVLDQRPPQSLASSTVAKYSTSRPAPDAFSMLSLRFMSATTLAGTTIPKRLRPILSARGSHSRFACSWSAGLRTLCRRQSARMRDPLCCSRARSSASSNAANSLEFAQPSHSTSTSWSSSSHRTEATPAVEK